MRGRPRTKLSGPSSLEEVRTEQKQSIDPREKDRLQAVRLGMSGDHTLEQISDLVGKARSTIQIWFSAFKEGGLDALLERKRPTGRGTKMTSVIQDELRKGLEEGRWRTGVQINDWLRKTHKVHLHPSRVYYWLKKLNARLKMPRRVNPKKDPDAAERFEAELYNRILELELPDDKPVRLWIQDECRIGLHTELRRCWSLPGIRVVKQAHQKYEWCYVWGALEVGGQGGSVFSYTPTVSNEWTEEYLIQLSKYDPDSTHVVIWDGAGFHPDDHTHWAVPSNVRPIKLPPYSPELNPVEGFWDMLKDCTCNRLFGSIEEIQEVVTEFLRPYWDNPEKVLQFVCRPYLLAAENV